MVWMKLELDDCFCCCWNFLFGFGNCVVFDGLGRYLDKDKKLFSLLLELFVWFW